MKKFFLNKADTLISLKLKSAKIPKLIKINFKEYFSNKNYYLSKINKEFKNSKIVIRSSFSNEDTDKTSNAGKYESYLNISSNDQIIIHKKIINLSELKKNINKEYFFIQKMITDVKFSGVILTRNLVNYSECVNINYHEGNSTEIVTSGKKNTKNLIYFQNKKFKIPQKFLLINKCIKEIKKITKEINLDIEFAVDKKNQLQILQVRKLIIPSEKIKKKINYPMLFNNLEKKIMKLKLKQNDLYGETTFFGNMPDWNPAEIIGLKPRPLALSLYQELITNHVWSSQRLAYGYKDLSQFHLMTTFYGTPYIDVRIDFNSWLPIELDKNISKKLMNYYLTKFKNNENIQDKIEFEIVFSCITFNTKKRLFSELKNFLNKEEINTFYKCLKNINIRALNEKNKDTNLIKILEKKQKDLKRSNLYEIDKIYWAIEDCKKFGTLPFAGLARCGFIAIELLNSLVEIKAISHYDRIKFLSNINTITSDMKRDLLTFQKKDFLNKYGHLRPGTYDITSPNYKNNFDKYFGKIIKIKNKNSKMINDNLINNIEIKKNVQKLGIYQNPKSLLNFIKESIVMREYSKFIFSKSIDYVFENLIKFGKKYNITTEDLSFIKISKILDMYYNLSNYGTINNLKKHISENKKEYYANKDILLPDVIKSAKDLYIQKKNYDKINFISDKFVTTKIIIYNNEKIKKIYNGAVCIENADPGYDFLFNKNIKALITKYGGLNSHMAIRCAELNIPALIGVGEKNFENIIKHKTISINCNENKIELINI